MLNETFCNIRAAKNDASLVKDLYDITMFDSASFRFLRIQPARLIEISVFALDLHGFYLTAPRDIIALCMNTPSAVIGHTKQRICFCPFRGKALVMPLSLFHPVRNRRTFFIVRHEFFDVGRRIFQQSRWSLKRIFCRIFRKVSESRYCIFGGLAHRDHKDLLFIPFFKAHPLFTAGCFIEETNSFFFRKIACISFDVFRSKLLEYLYAHIKVGNRFSARRNTRFFFIDRHEGAAGHIVSDIMHFMLGAYRKKKVCKVAVVFHPRMLYYKSFNIRISICALELKAVIPAGNIARSCRPDHMDAAHTRTRILVFLKLVVNRRNAVVSRSWISCSCKAAHSHPLCVFIHDRRLHQTSRDILFRSRKDFKQIHDLRSPLFLIIRKREAAHLNI